MARIIFHLDMDYFFAQIEEVQNPRFKGKPLVVGADPQQGRGRGVVSTANYQARKYGIKSGMPISRAWKACPQAVFLPVNFALYRKISNNIMEIVQKYSNKCEIAGLDEAYLDVSFLGSYERAERLAKKIKQDILKKEKLTCSIGVAPSKVVAKIAANQVKPDGFLVVKPNHVRQFLAPLSIRRLPGIGPKTAERLNALGVTRIRELRLLSRLELEREFGKRGAIIYQTARGTDREPVSTKRTIKSLGKEHTFRYDTRDSELIFKIVNQLIKEIYQEILKNNFFFKTVIVRCRYHNFETHTRAKTLKKYTQSLEILTKVAKRLLLEFILENPKPIRLIGVRVSMLR